MTTTPWLTEREDKQGKPRFIVEYYHPLTGAQTAWATGMQDKGAAKKARGHVEALLDSRFGGTPESRPAVPSNTRLWVDRELSKGRRDALKALGLLDSVVITVNTALGTLADKDEADAGAFKYGAPGTLFREYLDHCGRKSPDRAASSRTILQRLATLGGWTHLHDITKVSYGKVIDRLHDGRATDDGRKFKSRTRRDHRQVIVHFLDWCVDQEHIAVNPLANATPILITDAEERTALDFEEQDALYRAAELSEWSWRGMSGPERALFYRLTVYIGLRANEICSLVAADFILNSPTPTLTLRPTITKNKRGKVYDLLPPLARMLRSHLKDKAPTDRAFSLKRPESTAAMLRADMQAAKEAWIAETTDPKERARRTLDNFLMPMINQGTDAQPRMVIAKERNGQTLVFHSLRHTTCTNACRLGWSVAEAQDWMRHSTPVITLNTYNKISPSDRSKTAAKFAPLMESIGLEATGTSDALPFRRDMANDMIGRTSPSFGVRSRRDDTTPKGHNPSSSGGMSRAVPSCPPPPRDFKSAASADSATGPQGEHPRTSTSYPTRPRRAPRRRTGRTRAARWVPQHESSRMVRLAAGVSCGCRLRASGRVSRGSCEHRDHTGRLGGRRRG